MVFLLFTAASVSATSASLLLLLVVDVDCLGVCVLLDQVRHVDLDMNAETHVAHTIITRILIRTELQLEDIKLAP